MSRTLSGYSSKLLPVRLRSWQVISSISRTPPQASEVGSRSGHTLDPQTPSARSGQGDESYPFGISNFGDVPLRSFSAACNRRTIHRFFSGRKVYTGADQQQRGGKDGDGESRFAADEADNGKEQSNRSSCQCAKPGWE